MRNDILLAVSASLAAAAPLVPRSHAPASHDIAWPDSIDGRRLTSIAPTALDRRLAQDFPGTIARFSDGRRQIVLRHVPRATRQLHPARDCFEAIGYRVTPIPMARGANGALSSCFKAARDGHALKICERIVARDGGSFPDVSSWYWPALLGRSAGPWLATTSVERLR
jgi:hypothetical protein